jgi:outer membrane protein OmpA-like peptidoglycan-associated protein
MRTDCVSKGRHGLGRRLVGAVVGGLVAVAAATGLGGCNNDLKDKNAALLQENQELRDRNAQLEQSLAAADTARSMNDSGGPWNTPSEGSARSGRRPASGADWDGSVRVGRRGNDVVVAVAGDVLFDSGQATLKPAAKKTLDKVAANLKSQYTGHRIRVEGYTDSDPIRKSKFPSNEALSQERANVVQNYLASKGISRSMISAVGMGSANPKATKKDSRRVEIVILDSRD